MGELEKKEYPKRTNRQNRALHVMFGLLARELNDNGLDMRKTLKPSIDIPWTDKSVKEYLWRPVQKLQLNKASTTELTTVEIDEVFDTIVRHLGETFGVGIQFPTIDATLFEIEAQRREKLKKEKASE